MNLAMDVQIEAMRFMMKQKQIKRSLSCALLLLASVLYSESTTRLVAQKQSPADKPWHELVSTEGRFRVLLPDTPSELFVPVPGQVVNGEVRVFIVKSTVASFIVLFGDLPESGTEELKNAFDNGRDRAVNEGKLRLISEKDISTPGVMGREYVMDDGAFVIRNRVYYSKGRIYETIFAGPRLNGMSAGLVQYYDGLAGKFFNSFKIEAASSHVQRISANNR